MYWKTTMLAYEKPHTGCTLTYRRPNSPEQTPRTFILKNNLDAVQDTAILLHALILRLQFTLQL